MKSNFYKFFSVRASVGLLLAIGVLADASFAKPPQGIEKQIKLGDGAARAPERAHDEAPKPIPASEVKGPRGIITADETTHDFGGVWVGPPLKHSFKIKNTGDAALDITRVRPSCGCTIAGDYPKKLDPGQEGEFPFSMMSNKLRGVFEKSITITSNDPVTPELRLKLRGEVKRYVDITPQSANFGKVLSNEPQTRDLVITNNTDKPLELTAGEPTDKRFKFEVLPKTPGKEFTLRVTLTPTSEPGNLKSQVTLTTNVPEQKDLQIDATATIPARLEIQPQVVAVMKAAPGAPADQGTSRVVRFTNYGKNPVKVLEATCDDPAVKVTINERKAGEQYNINVEMPANYEVPTEGKSITLKTDDAEVPTFRIPLQSSTPPQAKTAEAAKRPEPAGLIGQPAPAFPGTQTVEGKPFSPDAFKDTVTVIDFFAPNCGYCKKQIPRLETIRANYADKGVRFVNVSEKMGTKEFTKDEVVDLVKGLGFRGELVIDHENAIGPLFAANSYPTMLVVGKTGKVEAANVGNVEDLETRLSTQIDSLLAGKPIPPTMSGAQTAKAEPAKEKPTAPSLVGKPAAPFNLTTVDGKPLTNAELANAPATVLDFFAVNCGYCGKQIPRVETVRKEFAGKGVRFVAVQNKMGKEFTEDEAKAKLKEFGWEGELARDMENKVGPTLGVNGFPSMVVVGKSGKVEALNIGNIPDLETRLKGQLEALIAGKPIPAEFATPAENTPAKRATADDLAGKPAPSFELNLADGKKITNTDLAASGATILNFFAVNCPHCLKQIPKVEGIRKEYAAKGVRFINVQQTMGGKPATEEELTKKLTEAGWGGELAKDPENKVGPKFNATGFPTMLVLGKSGKVEAANSGNAPDLESKLKMQLDLILAGKEVPKSAAAPSQQPAPRPAMGLVGQPAPQFALETLDGKKISNEDLSKNQATVLNFVAPNCGYCKKQLPAVEPVRKEYESKGVRFVNVWQKMGTKDFTNEEAIDVFKGTGAQLELAKDADNKVGQSFKAVSYPTMMIVNKQGVVEYVNIGAKADMDTRLRGQLDAIMGGKKWVEPETPAPAAAPGQPGAAAPIPVKIQPATPPAPAPTPAPAQPQPPKQP